MPYKDLEKGRECRRQHYRDNKEKYADKAKRWRAENPERKKELRRLGHLRTREMNLLRLRLWRAERKACRRKESEQN